MWLIVWMITGALVGHTLGKPYGTQHVGTLWGLLLGPLFGAAAWWIHNKARAPKCPECLSVVPVNATRCRSCHAEMTPVVPDVGPSLDALRILKFAGVVAVVLGCLALLARGIVRAIEANQEREAAAERERRAEETAERIRVETAADKQAAEMRTHEAALRKARIEAAKLEAEAHPPPAVTLPTTENDRLQDAERKEQATTWLKARQTEAKRKAPPVYTSLSEACAAAIARDLVYRSPLSLLVVVPTSVVEHIPPPRKKDKSIGEFVYEGSSGDIFLCQVRTGNGYRVMRASGGVFPFKDAAAGVLPGV